MILKPGMILQRKSDGIIFVVLKQWKPEFIKDTAWTMFNLSGNRKERRYETNLECWWDELKNDS